MVFGIAYRDVRGKDCDGYPWVEIDFDTERDARTVQSRYIRDGIIGEDSIIFKLPKNYPLDQVITWDYVNENRVT